MGTILLLPPLNKGNEGSEKIKSLPEPHTVKRPANI